MSRNPARVRRIGATGSFDLSDSGECMTDHATHRRPHLLPLLAGALLLAVAGCGSEPAEPAATAEPAPAAPAAQGAAATPGPAVEERLSTVNCQTPAQNRVFFSVGSTVFAVPGDAVRTVLPPGTTPTTPADQVLANLRAQTAEGAGCPERPLRAALLGVAGPAGDPLLGDAIGLFSSQPGAIAGPYGNLTREMLANSAKCQAGEGGLIACPAIEQEGTGQTQSLYLVSTDRNRTLGFGGPLAARCIVVEERIRGCEIVDELPGGVGLRAPLRTLPQSSEGLAAAHRAAVAQVTSLRL